MEKRSSTGFHVSFAMVACAGLTLLQLMAAPWASPAAVESLVTAAGPSGSFNRNDNNEPGMAVDASRPNVLVISAHEMMDQQACSRAASTTRGICTFPVNGLITNAGVGFTGVYFSFDSGHTWIQPTYQGLTAADCAPAIEPCVPTVGPI